jgi:hypothetical protein
MLILVLLLLYAIALAGWGVALFQLRQSRVALAAEEQFADITLRENDKLLLENMALRCRLGAKTASPADLIRADPEYPPALPAGRERAGPTADPGGPF